MLGLLDAMGKFDPARGTKFKTYAELRIKGAILDSLRNLDWAPRSLRKKSKDLEKAYKELEQQLGRSATDKEISDKMGLTLDEFYDLVDQCKGLNLGSIQDLGSPDDEKDGEPLVKYVPDAPCQMDPFFVFQRGELRHILNNAIDSLPKKERLVVSFYYYDELTMKEIGEILCVNESRISQLHTKAMLRLRGRLDKVLYEKQPERKTQPLSEPRPQAEPRPRPCEQAVPVSAPTAVTFYKEAAGNGSNDHLFVKIVQIKALEIEWRILQGLQEDAELELARRSLRSALHSA